jgi:hypothetical protein
LDEINRLNKHLHETYSLPAIRRVHVYDQKFFVSRTTLSPTQYSPETVASFLDRLGVTRAEYEESGVFLLRSTLMNPWYGLAKSKGRDYLVALVAELFSSAKTFLNSSGGRG